MQHDLSLEHVRQIPGSVVKKYQAMHQIDNLVFGAHLQLVLVESRTSTFGAAPDEMHALTRYVDDADSVERHTEMTHFATRASVWPFVFALASTG